MKKILLFIIVSFLFCADAEAQKISELPEATTVASGDYLILNVANATTKEISVDNFLSVLLASGNVGEAVDAYFKSVSILRVTGEAGYVDLYEYPANGNDYSRITGAANAGSSPAFTFGGSAANSENLTLTLGANDNTATVSSGSGVTDLSLSGINLLTTGTIAGRVPRGADITGAIAHNTTDLHGKVYVFTAAATVTLDAAAHAGYGATVCYRIRDAGEAAVIDVDNAEKINLNGVALAAGVAITATGAGEYCCLMATTDTDASGTDGWETWGCTSGWVSE